ncbi:MAG TPA: prolyl oligopeptidase family serine peptidase [Candidatus Binatia bacterium]|nr:prolyl oligopeptidase family serine peptidase [Candidatus Binatia bacterium]
MSRLALAPPHTPAEPVIDVLHGATIADPYRWLEEQHSSRTRDWLGAQTRYAGKYFDSIRGREHIQERVRELLDVETYDSLRKIGERYFFRKRLPGQEQFCIYFRDGAGGGDQLLIDPETRRTGAYTAVKLLRVSGDGRLLLYEVKQGGERSGRFELFDVEARHVLPDTFSRGYLRGFAFAPDSQGFYYVFESDSASRPYYRAVYHHVLGTDFKDDREIFCAGEDQCLRLQIVPGGAHLGLVVFRFGEQVVSDFFLWAIGSGKPPEPIIRQAAYKFGPLLLDSGRLLAITDREAPNLKIVEVRRQTDGMAEFVDVVPETDAVIQDWAVAGSQVFASYLRNLKTEVDVFNLSGERLASLPVEPDSTVRLHAGGKDCDALLFEQESFTQPIEIYQYSPANGRVHRWASHRVPLDSKQFTQCQVWFCARDGTRIPMYLVGRHDVFEAGPHPCVMTSYGGYGVAMTPQFSVFVTSLLERGCLFALPNIRGGSEFGAKWHESAKRRKRQVAFDDFIAAAEWLIESRRTEPEKLAIFGGSNSGLLVGAAMTQRPELFRAVLCMVPMLDMLRYHLFDHAHVWKSEFGAADDVRDFTALLGYSPYHHVRPGTAYPAVMFVSGDSDQNCNALHTRKMTARLQAANVSPHPIVLDYETHRGHSPVLPLTTRIEALTKRIAFICDQLKLPA